MVGRLWPGVLVWLAISCFGAAACNDTVRVEFVCAKYCSCANPSPAAQDRCTDECIADLTGFPIPDECADCIALNECRTLEDECTAPCQIAVPRMSMVDEETDDETID